MTICLYVHLQHLLTGNPSVFSKSLGHESVKMNTKMDVQFWFTSPRVLVIWSYPCIPEGNLMFWFHAMPSIIRGITWYWSATLVSFICAIRWCSLPPPNIMIIWYISAKRRPMRGSLSARTTSTRLVSDENQDIRHLTDQWSAMRGYHLSARCHKFYLCRRGWKQMVWDFWR